MSTRALTIALAAFQRRAVFVKSARIAIATAGVAVLIAEVAAFRPDLFGERALAFIVAVTLASILIGVVHSWRQMPAPLDAARRVDRVAGLNDLIVTAVEREGRDDELSAAIARAAHVDIQGAQPASAYPLEFPGQWRLWLILAAAVQIVAIGLVWRAPADRPIAPSSSSLSIPGGGSGTPGQPSTASAKDAKPAVTASTGPESGRQSQPAVTSLPPASASASVTPPQGAAASSGTGLAAPSPSSIHHGAERRDDAGQETPAGSNRYRQAAARADDVVAQGRVPAALRGVVERYFAAIREQEKR